MTATDGSEFDAIADEYDRVRPSYPDALVDAACDRARLLPGACVLEIGCGTGLLTEMLVARGLRVEAVDPGPSMVDAARRRVGDADVRFHLGRFEDVDLPRESFAAAFSGERRSLINDTTLEKASNEKSLLPRSKADIIAPVSPAPTPAPNSSRLNPACLRK